MSQRKPKPIFQRRRAVRLLSALVVAGLIAVSWMPSVIAGGANEVPPLWFFVPILVAGLRFGVPGAIVVAVVSGLVAGPLTPADVEHGIPQGASDWLIRTFAFLSLGVFMALVMRRLKIEASAHAQSAAALHDRARQLADVERLAHVGVWQVCLATGQVTWSTETARIFGRTPEEVEPTFEFFLKHVAEEDRELVTSSYRGAMAGDTPAFEFDYRIKRPDGSLRTLHCGGAVDYDSSGTPIRLLGSAHDVTEARAAEQQLITMAATDPLTGLPNRRCFDDELKRQLARVARYERGSGALLLIDIDLFKFVNDSYGHPEGDTLLCAVASALTERLRSVDVVSRLGLDPLAELAGNVAGRLGGDEFGVLLTEVNAEQALAVAQQLIELVRTLDTNPRASITVGIATFDEKRLITATDLLAEADVALYEAKAAGRGRAALYSGRSKTLGWVQSIREALDDDRFVLHSQPIICLRTGVATQEELLIRMVNENGELIFPGAFLPTAERFDLMQEIDCWVLRGALDLARKGRRVQVNLSARTLGQAWPAELLEEAINDGLDPHNVVFEVTETAAATNLEEAGEFTRRISDLGSAVALDDFGTGFGAFSYLKHLKVDYLKIDREFVDDLPNNATGQRVVKAVVSIARGLGQKTVAEGVEDLATLDALRRYGVDFAQGYYIARPAALDQVEGFAITGGAASLFESLRSQDAAR